MHTLFTVVHVITCVLIVLVVLLQSGKGAEISSSFAGSSQTVFGSSGGANFFTRFTAGAAALFFVTSVFLTKIGGDSRKSLFEGTPAASRPNAAAATAPSGPAAGGVPAAQSGAAATAPSAAAPAAATAPNQK